MSTWPARVAPHTIVRAGTHFAPTVAAGKGLPSIHTCLSHHLYNSCAMFLTSQKVSPTLWKSSCRASTRAPSATRSLPPSSTRRIQAPTWSLPRRIRRHHHRSSSSSKPSPRVSPRRPMFANMLPVAWLSKLLEVMSPWCRLCISWRELSPRTRGPHVMYSASKGLFRPAGKPLWPLSKTDSLNTSVWPRPRIPQLTVILFCLVFSLTRTASYPTLQRDWEVLAGQSVDCTFKLETDTCDPVASRLIDENDVSLYFQL